MILYKIIKSNNVYNRSIALGAQTPIISIRFLKAEENRANSDTRVYMVCLVGGFAYLSKHPLFSDLIIKKKEDTRPRSGNVIVKSVE